MSGHIQAWVHTYTVEAILQHISKLAAAHLQTPNKQTADPSKCKTNQATALTPSKNQDPAKWGRPVTGAHLHPVNRPSRHTTQTL